MASKATTTRRKQSLDLSDGGVGIAKFMDLRRRLSISSSPYSTNVDDVKKVQCECCGLWEDCTGAYARMVRARFCGRWVCGLCSEAINDEVKRRVAVEKANALAAHIEVCRSYNRTVRVNPAMSLLSGMRKMLRRTAAQREVVMMEAQRN